jgi:hypothetical protein
MLGFTSLLSAAAGLMVLARAAGDDIAPIQPKVPSHEFSLNDFGAVPNGRTSNTEAFRRAIAAVQKDGGGTLVVPAGEYFTGPIDLASALNLRLERGARLVFSDTLSDYPQDGGEVHSLISARDCHDIAISGEGTIDGNGSAWWERVRVARAKDPIKHDDAVPRPHLIVFDHCRRVRLSGVTLTRSPMFHFVPAFCEEVTVQGITIVAPPDSPNTDGIDPSQTKRMLIAHCQIDTGDDCIAFKAGGSSGPFVEDVLVTDCTFKRGHGCSVGSATRSGLRRITIRRCLFDGTDVGVRFKSNRMRGGMCEEVTFADLVMRNVGMPILIYSYYPFPLGAGLPDPPEPGKHAVAAPITSNTPIWRRLTVRNLAATGTSGSAGMILGLPEMPVSELLLENISVEAGTGLRIGYARNVTLRHVRVTASKGPPLLIEDTVEALEQSDTAGVVSAVKVGDTITVESKGGPLSYKAVVNSKEGGDITQVNLPADGRVAALGLNQIFFFGTHGDQYTLRGWTGKEKFVLSCSTDVISQSAGEVVVQVNLIATGTFKILEKDEAVKATLRKTLVGYKDKTVVVKRVYAFKPDRVVMKDELLWVYPDMELKRLDFTPVFTPGCVQGPARLVNGSVRASFLVVGSSGGKVPKGISYPFTAENFLKNGYKVSLRTTAASFDLGKSDMYFYEKPWQ